MWLFSFNKHGWQHEASRTIRRSGSHNLGSTLKHNNAYDGSPRLGCGRDLLDRRRGRGRGRAVAVAVAVLTVAVAVIVAEPCMLQWSPCRAVAAAAAKP